jgi:release factor glutamine methyltransferase
VTARHATWALAAQGTTAALTAQDATWEDATGRLAAQDATGAFAGQDATIAALLRTGSVHLAAAGVENPRLEARLLLAHALHCRAEDLYRDLSAVVRAADFMPSVARRSAREPLAYILGWREFWSLPFHVSPATLIPRPESETIVAAALSLCPDPEAPSRVLDLGTGTGCLLLAFLHERPRGSGVGIDRAEAAVRLARRNAAESRLEARTVFLCGDWAEPISGRFDLVLSNPPYIAAAEFAGLMPEVAEHEPRLALDGGPDGLAAYRAIIAALPGLLTPAGAAVLELGSGQFTAVAALARRSGLGSEARRDLAGEDRAMILRRSP